MKIAILGDLHFGARSASDAIIYHQKKFFDFFFSYLKNNGINTIIQLGDVFDNRRQTNSKALSFAYLEFFDKLEEYDIKMYSLLGNHDLYYRESVDIHTGGILLRQFKNITIFEQPTTVTIGDVNFDFIPWICDGNKQQCFDYIANSTSKYCLGHFEINNFEMLPNVHFTNGIECDIFKKYNKVFSGHFHIKSDKGNICYVGTPYQLNWSDAYKDKSFIVFDTENHTYQEIVNDDKFHVILEYDDVNKIYSSVDVVQPNSFIKLVVKNKTEPYLFNNYTKKVYDTSPADVKFIESKLTNLMESEEIRMNIQTMEDVITNYIRNSSVENKDDLIQYMLMLYNEAMMGGSS